MSRLVVRVVGPAGVERFLCRAREVSLENATVYGHPSAARNAAYEYANKMRAAKQRVYVDVIDADDPEARVAA